MKKFISMLAGVVMASSLFAVSAYAAGNVTFTADKTEVKEGETVTITINSLAKTVSTDGFNVQFDKDLFEVTSVAGNYYEAYHAIKQVAPPIDKMYDAVSTVAEANATGTFGFGFAGANDVNYQAAADLAKITFTAKVAGDAAFVLNENSAGASGYKGVVDTINVVVKGDEPVTPPAPVVTWKEADASWVAPEGKKAIWWPFDYEAGTFPGHVFVEVTDGTRTETIGIGTDAAYDVNGAVSFAVAVILDAEVDATNFDCVVK